MDTMQHCYKVGDKIAYNTSNNYYWPAISVVKKVLATRVETENGKTFSLKTGREIGVDYPKCRILDLQQVEDYIGKKEKAAQASKTVREAATPLHETLSFILKMGNDSPAWLRITEEQLSAMRHLTALLAKNEEG